MTMSDYSYGKGLTSQPQNFGLPAASTPTITRVCVCSREPPLFLWRNSSVLMRRNWQPKPTSALWFGDSTGRPTTGLNCVPQSYGTALKDRLEILLPHVVAVGLWSVPLRRVERPTCDLRLVGQATGLASTLTYPQYFAELLSAYPNQTAVCTDGSFVQKST